MGMNSFPLWTRRVVPAISGRMTMSRAWVFIMTFCPLVRASLAILTFSKRMRCSLVSPRWRLRRWREGSKRMNSSIERLCSCSRVCPRYVNSFGIFCLPQSMLDGLFNFSWGYFLLFCFLPAPRAAIRPTFLPGGAPRATVVTLRAPRLLLPNGCAAATMAFPRVRGYLWPFAFFL